ncbi:uncharacterized protein LOC135503142 isoform X2 [Lineus longissimus]|uniref:uncharacterized protein LOC135503142 isoform X2 n=1 Tax=Lineus longissimus TaxID=88925 RepID=UPI00315DE3E4
MTDVYDKYPSFIPSASKTEKNGSSRHHKAPLSQSETKAEINRKKLYEGGSIFLEELCSLPMTQRAAEAVMEIKKGNTLFGSLGALAASAGLFVANACVSPIKVATSVVAKTSPTAAVYVDSTAAVLLESVETALPVIRSDPVKVARRLKYRSVKLMYDGARCVVKSQIGQCALKTVNTLVEGAEVMLAYVAPLDSCAETAEEPGDGLRTEEESGEHKGTQTPASPKPETSTLVCRVLALPFRTALMVTKPIQRTMVYFAKSRRYRKTGRTPCLETRTAKKSLEGRPRASPRKRASKPEKPPFYRRLATSLLVTLKIMNPPQPEDTSVQPPNYVFDPNIVPSPKHKFAKRSHDDVGSDDGTLSDIMGDLEDYCSDDDPNYEWDYSCMGEDYDSFEYMTDSFSDLEEELDFVEKEAGTNILGGLQCFLDKNEIGDDGGKNYTSDSKSGMAVSSKAKVTESNMTEVKESNMGAMTEPNMAEVTKGMRHMSYNTENKGRKSRSQSNCEIRRHQNRQEMFRSNRNEY